MSNCCIGIRNTGLFETTDAAVGSRKILYSIDMKFRKSKFGIQIFGYLHTCTLRKATSSFVMSLAERPSVRPLQAQNNSAPTRLVFIKFYISEFLKKG
jgi:hypothetical protein